MKQLTVLMVEDSAPDAELILREIRRGGYAPIFERVDHAAALQEALTARSWDIILADYSLPRFSAPEAFAVLRAVGLDIPFIIVSGTIGEETAVDAMRLGVQDYILKHKLTRLVPAIERELIEAARRAEHRRMRRDLERAEQMLARSERLRTLGQMASGISHDLKNVVISPTSLQVQIAERALRCGNKEMAVEALAAIRAILKDGLMTIECLSDFCRYPSLKPSVAPIDLNQVVHRAVGMAQARVQPGQGPSLRFVKELGEIPAVQASATEVLSAVVNLLVNAIDAMPDGGPHHRAHLLARRACLPGRGRRGDWDFPGARETGVRVVLHHQGREGDRDRADDGRGLHAAPRRQRTAQDHSRAWQHLHAVLRRPTGQAFPGHRGRLLGQPGSSLV